MPENQVYRHYGSDKFDHALFIPVTNEPVINKPSPHTGLWASPLVDNTTDWADWCEGESFNTERLATWFDFRLKPGARIAVIKRLDDMGKYPLQPPYRDDEWWKHLSNRQLDYEKMAENYDAILYWESGCMHGTTAWNPWDCDSLLVLNPDVVKEIKS